jgi:hypothetical protein
VSVSELSISWVRGGAPGVWANRRVLLICAAVAAAVAVLLFGLVPVGGDAAAHLYRTSLVRRGVLVWDNLWFAGHYPLFSYSLFYYLPAAVLGNNLLGALGVVLSAVLFGSIVLREWGPIARWPAYAFAVLAGGQFFTGDYPYTIAFAALLATIWALQRRRMLVAVVCAALTLGFNPLAFLFLCLALLALFPLAYRPRSRSIVIALTLGVLVGVELGALWLFPSRGLYYPFGLWRFALGFPIGVAGSLLALRSRRGSRLASLFIVWSIAVVIAFAVPSPIGHNLLRPEAIVFPLMLLAALLTRFKPYWLAVPAVASAFAANVVPYLWMAPSRVDPASKASFWAPMLGYIARHPAPSFRLEVVPEINHWESYFVPKAGYAMARGWYQQLDSGNNPGLQRGRLTPAAYRSWLRSVGVRYVIAPNADPASGAGSEAKLVDSGRSGLTKVFQAPSGAVYELPGATPILTGPAPAAITSQTSTRISGRVSRPGSYLLRVHYTPYWKLTHGSLCLRRASGDMTRLEARRAGPFTLRAIEKTGALLEIIVDGDHSSIACPS